VGNGRQADRGSGEPYAERLENLSEDRRKLLEKLLRELAGEPADAGSEAGASTGEAEAASSSGQGSSSSEASPEEAPPGEGSEEDSRKGPGQENPWAETWRQAAELWQQAAKDPGRENPWAETWRRAAEAQGYPGAGAWQGPSAGPDPTAGGADPWAQWQQAFGGPGQPNPWAELWQSGGSPWSGFEARRGRAGGSSARGPFEPGAGPPRPPPPSLLIAMKPSGSRPPFFCVHALLGSVFPYHRLALYMAPDQPFYGLQAAGLDGTRPPLDRIEDMASLYLEAVRTVQPRGPYRLGGYSFGGWVAFEMAQQLIRDGEEVGLLANVGAGVPLSVMHPPWFEQMDFFAKSMGDFSRLVVNAHLADSPHSGAGFEPGAGPFDHLTPIQRVTLANCVAQSLYVPRPYSGGMDLFLTEEQQRMFQPEPTMGWKTLCREPVAVHPIAGNHLNIFTEPQVLELAAQLTVCLERGVSDGHEHG
jgi:thioesterase domain-containing protein